MIVGLTSGCFDLIHFGHVVYLERCKALCDKLIVGVDSDALVSAAKGDRRPLIPAAERLELVNNLHPVDSAFILDALDDLHDVAIRFAVNRVFKHEGFRDLEHVVGVAGTGAELFIVEDVKGLISTTAIIDRVLERFGATATDPAGS